MLFSRNLIILISSILLLIIGVFILPNTLNSRERQAFSEEERLKRARELYKEENLGDSAVIIPGGFYERGRLHQWLLGSKYRTIWRQPVEVPVLRLSEQKGGLDTVQFSGSQQTIGIDVQDAQGRVWAIRSVNKDQSKALPGILQPSLLRFLFRDQAAALNPYAALVLPVLSDTLGLHHSNPTLYLFPYNEKWNRYNNRMAGRLVLMEEEADETWAGYPEFKQATHLMDTEEMLDTARSTNIPVDTILYARSRLFDMLINDWDRHEGNWEWALMDNNDKHWIEPIPMDRDMAFYKFNEGALNKITLLFNNKFQSFTPEFEDVEGLMYQSQELDKSLLRTISREELHTQAIFIQQRLTDNLIEKAFRQYPAEIYQEIGQEHATILKSRLQQLPKVAEQFYELLQKD